VKYIVVLVIAAGVCASISMGIAGCCPPASFQVQNEYTWRIREHPSSINCSYCHSKESLSAFWWRGDRSAARRSVIQFQRPAHKIPLNSSEVYKTNGCL